MLNEAQQHASAAPQDAAESAATDTFAPTGAQQDDLFDDVVPAPETMRLRSEDDLFSDDFTPAAQPVVEQSAPEPSHEQPFEAPRGRGGRGRGRARGPRDNRDGQTRTDTQAHAGAANRGRGAAARGSRNTDVRTDTSRHQAPENAPSGPRKDVAQPVRGDRLVAGGIRKPKITEEELAEKMARIQIKNVSLTAAHARAEADAASFAEREHQAKTLADQRRKEERRDRQQMMGEREKNRLRKLKAMTGREW